jgi:V/A-type H+-transporting ATPase subunit A
LLAAEIIKNGFLQQNSFDEVDMYCVPAKQVRLLELIMEFYRRARETIKLGAPLYKITSLTAGGVAAETGETLEHGAVETSAAGSAVSGSVKRPLRERLSRLKSEIKNGDDEAFAAFEREMNAAFESLERSYRSKEML